MRPYYIDYDERLHAGYHDGRAHDASVMRMWREALQRSVGGGHGLTILDLGSGTGRFSSLLADALDAQVIGVEPSEKMRNVAETVCRDSRVRFQSGSAEHIPLADCSCEVAWMSQVIHHLPDIEAAASELSRVLGESGQVIVRNNFKGRLRKFCRYYEFFPSALAVDEARHPTVAHVEACFRRKGLRMAAFETIEQMESASLKEYAVRIGQRTYSTFELIPERDYEAGLAALQAAASREAEPRPVMGKVDLAVFRRG